MQANINMQILRTAQFSVSRPRRLVIRAEQNNNNERKNYNVRKGKQFENKQRRRGRPAHLRSPYDSPLRDGNRDRLIGLLTERAAKTLMIYLMETNGNVYSWLVAFYKRNPIPRDGSWDEISGEAFLRKLLSMPIEEAKYNTGRDSLFDNVTSCGVDPRSIAQRIMDIRTQLSEEFIQELQAIAEENSLLLRETLQTSLSTSLPSLDDPAAASSGTPVHPELKESPSSSSDSPASSSSSTSGSKGGAKTTPPPSPAPGAPQRKADPIKGASSSSSSSGKKSSDAADKAAAVASLNASLKKPTAAGSGGSSGSSAGSSDAAAAGSGSSDGKVDMESVLAQLRRAMEADVARDVLKMKETTASSSSNAAPAPDAAATDAPIAAGADNADSASAANIAEVAAVDESQQVVDPTPAAPADADALVVEAVAETAETPANLTPAAAAGDEGSSSGVASQLSNSAVGEAGTYSRMLPKGWGPRLGVGFSSYPRSHNNIVSSANLGVKSNTAGDALSGAAGEAV